MVHKKFPLNIAYQLNQFSIVEVDIYKSPLTNVGELV